MSMIFGFQLFTGKMQQNISKELYWAYWNVEDAYRNNPEEKLHRIWLALQSDMNKIVEEKGENKFKIPHLNKDMLEITNQFTVSFW
jgi:hypothetical protein